MMKAFTSFFGFIPTEENQFSIVDLFKAGLFRRLIPVDDLSRVSDCLTNRKEYTNGYLEEENIFYGIDNENKTSCAEIY